MPTPGGALVGGISCFDMYDDTVPFNGSANIQCEVRISYYMQAHTNPDFPRWSIFRIREQIWQGHIKGGGGEWRCDYFFVLVSDAMRLCDSGCTVPSCLQIMKWIIMYIQLTMMDKYDELLACYWISCLLFFLGENPLFGHKTVGRLPPLWGKI